MWREVNDSVAHCSEGVSRRLENQVSNKKINRMKNIKQYINRKKSRYGGSFNKTTSAISCLSVFLLMLGMTACTDFLELDPPKNKLTSEYHQGRGEFYCFKRRRESSL